MNLTVSKKDLSRAMTKMAGVAEHRSTMPVLSNVLLDATETGLRLAATDLFLALTDVVSANVKATSSIAVSAKELLTRVKTMPDGPLTLAADGKSLTLTAKGSKRRFTIRGMPGDDFPPLPKPQEGAPSFSIGARALATLIAKTHFSISGDIARAHINCALFEFEGSTMRAVSTDSHRLSKCELPSACAASTSMLVPQKGVLEVAKLCEDVVREGEDAPPIQLTLSGSSAFFAVGASTFAVKLVDATFPPYAQVIPKASEHIVRAPRAALADAVRAVSVAAGDKGGVRCTISKGTVLLKSESPDAGDGSDEVVVEYDGPSLRTGFEARYVLDVLGCLDCDEVEIGMNGELDPIIIRPTGGESSEFIVMPMRDAR